LDLDADAVLRLGEVLTPDEQRRAARHATPDLRRRFVVRRALLRMLLAAELDTRPELIELSRTRLGKPVLAPPWDASGVCFSQASCLDTALYAIGRVAMGVDVAARRPGVDTLTWVRREALAKATGVGLARVDEEAPVWELYDPDVGGDFDAALCTAEP